MPQWWYRLCLNDGHENLSIQTQPSMDPKTMVANLNRKCGQWRQKAKQELPVKKVVKVIMFEKYKNNNKRVAQPDKWKWKISINN